MSDTPETDARAFDAFDGQGGDEVVFANLARRFERERNKAEAGWLECRNFAQRIVDERDRYKSDVEVVTKERDEAREALDAVMGWAPQAPDYFNDKTKARWDDDMRKAWKVIREVAA